MDESTEELRIHKLDTLIKVKNLYIIESLVVKQTINILKDKTAWIILKIALIYLFIYFLEKKIHVSSMEASSINYLKTGSQINIRCNYFIYVRC